MSANQPSDHRIRAEPDRIAAGRLVAVGVGALLVFLAASVVTTKGLEVRRSESWPSGPPAVPAEVGQSKIGMVEQKPFETTHTGEEWRRAQTRRLESWGWADRKAGIAHMPIERAMELVVQGARP